MRNNMSRSDLQLFLTPARDRVVAPFQSPNSPYSRFAYVLVR